MNGHHGGAIAIGHLSYSNGNQDVAIGDNAKTGRDGDKNAGSQKMWDDGEGYVAIGANSFSNVGPGVIGYDPLHKVKTKDAGAVWVSTNGAVSVGNVSGSAPTKWITRQITGVAAGSADTDAVNVAQLKAAISSSTSGDGVHFYSVNETDSTKGNYDNKGANGTDALAAGVGAKTSGNYATAVGNNAQALNEKAVALGNGAIAGSKEKGEGATAVGNNAKALGDNAVALGNGAMANGQDSIALGTGAVADGIGATVIGQYNKASGQDSLAFGGGYNKEQKGNTASGVASVAFGEGTQALSEGSVAFGYGTQAGNKIKGKNDKYTYTGQNAVAFGNGTKALGGRSLAFGENTTANFNDSVAFGNGATAFSSGATAFGNRSRALSQYSTSFGDNSVAAGSMSFAFGTDTIAGAALDDNGALELNDGSRMDSYGNKAYTTTDTAGNKVTYSIKGMGIPSGDDVHDYVVVTGTKADGTTGTYVQDYQGGIAEVKVNADGTVTKVKDLYSGKYGGWYQYDEKGKLVRNVKGIPVVTASADMKSIPVTLDKATPGSNGYTLNGFKNATAFGYSTEASGDDATAFGNDTKAKAAAATAFGTTTTASGDNATAFGLSTTASGKQTTAFGSSTTASGDNATAFGENSTASGEAATAFGIGSTASGKNSLAALGGTASAENAAAIGSGAQATLAGSVALGSNSKTTRARYDDLTDTKEKTAYAKDASSTGPAWKATDNAIAVGNDSTVTRQITGVAAGSLDTDAVNVAQLRAVDAKHTIVTVGGQSATEDNTPVNGGNLDLKRTTATNGQETYDLSLDKNVTLGKQVENEGGKLTVNNVDKFKNYDKNGNPLPDTTVKEAVKIDGKTVSVVKHDGSDADNDQRQVVLGVDQDAGGYVTLYDNTGKKPTYIYNAISGGITYLKDKDSYLTPDPTKPNDERASNEFNRLEYGDYHTGTVQFIATLDDGQKYAGDNYQAAETKTKTVNGKTTTTVTKEEQNVLLKKLNERLDIKGGATGTLTDNNIGVNVENGVMKVQLAQNIDLGGSGSVTMGNTTINNGGVIITTKDGDKVTNTISLTDNGLNNGGKTITNVEGGTNPTDAVNVSQLNAAKTTVTSNDHSVIIDTTTDSTDKHKNYDLKIATATLSPEKTTGDKPVETGKVTVTNPKISVTENGEIKQFDNPNAYVTGNNVADAINHSGFKLIASKSEGDVTGNAETLIHPGDTMTIDAGKNISLTQTNGKISIATKDKLVLGKDTSDGKDGQEGTIGLTGRDGLPGADGKQGYSTTIIKTEKGQAGKDSKTGKENLAGTDMTRIVYTDKDGSHPQTVATLSDGLKFMGNDGQEVSKKLNETLSIKGGLDKDAVASASTKNLGVRSNKAGDGLEIVMTDTPDFTKVTVGEGTDPNSKITIGKQTVTGTKPDGSKSETSQTGNYITGLDNKAWDKNNVVADRAATEGQLKDAINEISGKDKGGFGLADENGTTVKKDLGQTITVKGDTVYAADGKTVVKDGNIKTAVNDDAIQISLNDQISIGQKGEKGEQGQPGTPGKDGKVTVETKGGATVVIGHNGADGDDGKDGLFVTGKDGKDGKSGVSITGPDGVAGKDGVDGKVGIAGKDGKDAVSIAGKGGVGHIGLTGPKGEKGKDGISIDITTDLKSATLDDDKNVETVIKDKDGKDTTITQAPRIQYDSNGKSYEVATMDDGQKYAGDFGDGVSVKLNKTVNIKGAVNKDAKETDFVDGNIAVVANKNGEDGELLLKLNKDLTGLNSSSYATTTKVDGKDVTSKTVVDGTGLKIEDGPSITNTGIDGGKHQITNVASGKDGKMYDTTVEGHGNWNNAANIGDVTNIAKSAADGVQAKSGKNITVDANNKVNLNDNITLGDDKDKTKQVSIDGNGAKITAGDGDNKVTVDGSKGQIVAGGDNGVKIGNITEGDSSLTIYDKDGNAKGTDKAGKYVTNLDNKTWNTDGSYVSGRAATEDQLHQVESNVNKQIADVNTKIDKVDKHHTEVTVNGGTAAKADGSYTDGNLQIAQKTGSDGQKIYDLKLSDNLNIGGAGKDGKDGQNGHMGINGADGKSGIGIDGEDGISIKGKDGKDGVTIKGIDGKNGTEGHIGLTGSAGKDGQNASADIHVKNGQVGVDGTDGHGGKDGMDRVVYEDHNHVTHEVATMDDGMKYSGDSGKAAVKLNKNVQIYGGAMEYADGNNIGVVASQDGDNAKLQVKLAKDLKGINSIEAKTITTGDTTMDNSGLTVKGNDNHKDITIHQGNVNMGGNKVSGVADGKVSKDSTDAVNGSQLWQRDQAINGLSGSVNKLGNRINRVGAGAAALAALHPLDFDPDDKWDFAAGYGNYRGANAAAVGAYYRPNEDTMFSVGGSFGGGENMVNAGVSIKLGQGNHVSTSRVAMAKEIKDLRQNVANLNAIVNRQSALIDKLTGTNAGMIKDKGNDLFPDVPANHWAYEYVTKLKHAGILTGYPDGNFDGDRMMTRYEFAAIVYRAIMAGAASNPALNQDGTLDKLANEFSSEMKYIRIDTIAKDKNGKPTIERVRVISDAK
ncbi:YadA-like family protein [Megasphaera elsdenii]|uniref:YadA-like family protein n=1 Tax=Megasphaera elsdenii TaxID=907 RepID=UPI0015BF4A88|nr:YadA-like family protein [Megasphaera elsdenii]